MITNSRLGEKLCDVIKIGSSQKIVLSTSNNTNTTYNLHLFVILNVIQFQSSFNFIYFCTTTI